MHHPARDQCPLKWPEWGTKGGASRGYYRLLGLMRSPFKRPNRWYSRAVSPEGEEWGSCTGSFIPLPKVLPLGVLTPLTSQLCAGVPWAKVSLSPAPSWAEGKRQAAQIGGNACAITGSSLRASCHGNNWKNRSGRQAMNCAEVVSQLLQPSSSSPWYILENKNHTCPQGHMC